MTSTPPSYRDIFPANAGGTIARIGFEFQDHVTCGYCLDMLMGNHIIEVWCETLDDFVVVYHAAGVDTFEFVQVKGSDQRKHWSISDLCGRESTKVGKKTVPKVGSSLLEKSLMNDQGLEDCLFRMVTTQPVDDRLKYLEYPLSSSYRHLTDPAYLRVRTEIHDKVKDFRSHNGNDAHFWIDRCHWEVAHSEDAVWSKNLNKVDELLDLWGLYLAPDQKKELYQKILRRVQDAGKANYRVDPDQKRLGRSELEEWLKSMVFQIRNPQVAGKGKKLQEKLEAAGLKDQVEMAQTQRRQYITKRRDRGFMALEDIEDIEADVTCELSHLMMKMDQGIIEKGSPFLDSCTNKLKEIKSQNQLNKMGTIAFLSGFMYDLADRCVFRFSEAKT